MSNWFRSHSDYLWTRSGAAPARGGQVGLAMARQLWRECLVTNHHGVTRRLALQEGFQLWEGAKIAFGAEACNLSTDPKFAVPSNTQSPLTLAATETRSSRMEGEPLPTMSAAYSARPGPDVRFNWPCGSLFRT